MIKTTGYIQIYRLHALNDNWRKDVRCYMTTLVLWRCRIAMVIASFNASTMGMAEVSIFDGYNPISYSLPKWRERPVTEVAAGMFDSDMEWVTGMSPKRVEADAATIRVYNLSTATAEDLAEITEAGVDSQRLMDNKDSFCLKAHGGRLYAVGADDRGTAYALLEVSRLAGVSPWVWWNDATPIRRTRMTLPDDYADYQSPAVEYRGIFLNDEDWSLQPWSWRTFDTSQPPGTIGVRTYKEIFKLLLRLRANTLWPAMHESTTPFYFVEGTKETADSFGIVIGTSHCEPLLRNNVGEWTDSVRGPYNYVTNRQGVMDYWGERLKEAGRYENLYTIGMRGKHDGRMAGVKTMAERVGALRDVIDDQRTLLKRYVGKDITAIPQVVVLYKEVLDVMNEGLTLPDDVTLMWCDDNYGHLTCLSDSGRRKRAGGAGIYYHLSYWGRPHDYLWIGGTQPGLVYNEMKTAYEGGARRAWIVNIHDPKTSSYQLELFMDMAWNVGSVVSAGLEAHFGSWLTREFGSEAGAELTPVMREFYRLCAVRRPEHTGWTQVELSDRKAYPRGRSHVVDTEFSFSEFGSEADRYLEAWSALAEKVKTIEAKVPAERRDDYFAQVKYPVIASGLMARKMLEAQRGRSYAMGQSGASLWERDTLMLGAVARSQCAYQELRLLTAAYNDSLAGGKWRHILSMSPRDLPVFNPPVLPVGLTGDEVDVWLSDAPGSVEPDGQGYMALDAATFTDASFTPQPVAMLGHSGMAVPVPKGEWVSYDIDWAADGDALLLTALIPTQPVDGGDVRVAVIIDQGEPQVVSIKEKGRSDGWKENVLRNQACVRTTHNLTPGRHTITIRALDDHIILDQLMLDTRQDRKFYTIPTHQYNFEPM